MNSEQDNYILMFESKKDSSKEIAYEEHDKSDGLGRPSVSKKRTRITISQKCELEKKFMESVYISKYEQEQLGQKLNLPTKTIQTWFKNRRYCWRKMYTFRTKPEETLQRVTQQNGNIAMAFQQSIMPTGFNTYGNTYGSYGYGRHGYQTFDFWNCDGPGQVCNYNFFQKYTHL